MDVFEVIDRVMTPNGIRPTVRYTYGYRTGEWEEIDAEMYEDGPGAILPELGIEEMSEFGILVMNMTTIGVTPITIEIG